MARWRWNTRNARPPLQPGDVSFLQGVHAAQVAEATPGAAWALYLMLLAVAAALAWAATSRVAEITKADGRVVPDGREQIVASLEGGLLRELLVKEGQRVTQGQELARLDPTRAEAQQAEGQAKRLALLASIARLTAEASGRGLQFPPEVAALPGLVQGETEAFNNRRALVQEAVGANRRNIDLLLRELRMAESMAGQGLMSDVEVMRVRRQVNELNLQSQERLNRFRQEASSELVRAQTELAQLDEQQRVRVDALRRTTLASPVAGWVKNIRANTVGGVVAAGAPVMEILPAGTRVLVEARIKPAEIGFVRVGQPAEIKLAAYDYTVYGGLKGTVEYISPDALGDGERTNGGPDATWYRALVRADAGTLRARGKVLEVIPGMTGSVEFHTGERSVLSFLLRPVMKSQEAFRER
jgi:membrane fusion protein, adhesin transport system